MSTDRRRHVLLLTDSVGRGGAERIVVNLALGLDPLRFRRTVCLTRPLERIDPQGEYGMADQLHELAEAGVGVLTLSRRSTADLAAWHPLLSFLRRGHVDVLHAHKFGANAWGAGLGRVGEVPLILAHEHTWSYEGQAARRFIDREWTARLAHRFIAPSSEDRRKMIEITGIPAHRIVVVPTAIPPQPPGDGGKIKAELEIPPKAPVLVAVSNLRPQKALEVTLQALALVRVGFPDTHLLLAGGGPEREKLARLAQELGLSEAIRLLGSRPDIPDLLAAADVAVLSSDFEGMPLAVLEYMAAGLPVVATAVGGVPELIEDGMTGLLVPPRDPAALARAVERLLVAPGERREMGLRARTRQRESYSMEELTRRLSEIYLQGPIRPRSRKCHSR